MVMWICALGLVVEPSAKKNVGAVGPPAVIENATSRSLSFLNPFLVMTVYDAPESHRALSVASSPTQTSDTGTVADTAEHERR